MQEYNSTEKSSTMEDLLSQAKALIEAIEKIKQEASDSVIAVEESEAKASTSLSSIVEAHDEINELLQIIKNISVEAAELFEKNQEQDANFETLASNVAAHEQRALATATSSEEKGKEIQTILENVTTAQKSTLALEAAAKKNDAEIQAILGQVTTSRDAILNLHDKAKTDSKNIERLSSTADATDARVTEYEEQLAQLQEQYKEINDRIEKLLPGATSVGLAKAFNERKQSLKPQIAWGRSLFLGAIFGFMALGFYGLGIEKITSLSQFFIFVFERSPIIAGLILLEEFGRRLYNHTLRLEEDYAYKETMSLSFDGYKKAMADIDNNEPRQKEVGLQTLTKTLSSNVLGTLNERPGRIYEEKEKGVNIDTVIKTLNPAVNEVAGNVFFKLYGDLKRNLRGSALKALAVIVLVAAFGIGFGYYFGQTKVNNLPDNINIGTSSVKTAPPSSEIKDDGSKE